MQRPSAVPLMTDTMDTTDLDPVCTVMQTPSIIVLWLQNMTTKERLACSLVSKAWAEAATAATRSGVILEHRSRDLSCLQRWLEKHGDEIEVFQIHGCNSAAALTALPCPKLQNLQLCGQLSIHGQFLSDIAAATKLTSVVMDHVKTPFKQAAVVRALTALPALKQLTWRRVQCSDNHGLLNSRLLQRLTSLTSLELAYVLPKGLNCLGSLSQLQHLSVSHARMWVAAGCPGLQELKALTSLELLPDKIDFGWVNDDILPTVCQLTALQQLHVHRVTCTGLNSLHVLTGLTQLRVRVAGPMRGRPLQLPGLQHLDLSDGRNLRAPSLARCTRLQVLKLTGVRCIKDSSNLVASTMLQHLQLEHYGMCSYATNPDPWQQVFPGLGRQLPYLTSLHLSSVNPKFRPSDIERVASCCSSLQVLHLDALSCNSALTRLSGLTSLSLQSSNIKQCCEQWSAVAQLTGLRELTVHSPQEVSAGGLRQLTALQHLTSLALVDIRVGNTTTLAPITVSPALLEQMSDRLPHTLTSQWPHDFNQYAIINKAPAGHPPDVSARLLRVCDMAAAGDG